MWSAFWLSFHSFMTNASLTEMHTISSTPWDLNSGASLLNRGTCDEEQVGVNAPGKEKTTTVFPANTSSLVRSTHSLSCRVRNLTSGTRFPSRFSNTDFSPELYKSCLKLIIPARCSHSSPCYRI